MRNERLTIKNATLELMNQIQKSVLSKGKISFEHSNKKYLALEGEIIYNPTSKTWNGNIIVRKIK